MLACGCTRRSWVLPVAVHPRVRNPQVLLCVCDPQVLLRGSTAGVLRCRERFDLLLLTVCLVVELGSLVRGTILIVNRTKYCW